MVIRVGKPVFVAFRYIRKLEGISVTITTLSDQRSTYPESWAS